MAGDLSHLLPGFLSGDGLGSSSLLALAWSDSGT